MEDIFQPQKSEGSGLSIKELFFKYIRFLPLFVISVALAFLVAYIYLRYATPVYRSSGSLVIKQDNPSPGGDNKLDQLLVSDNTKNIQSEIEFLHSRPLMDRVVKALNLNWSYYAVGNVREVNNYKTCPFYIEALHIPDSAASFKLNIVFEQGHRFTVNKDHKAVVPGQVFKNHFGTFRLVLQPGETVNEEYNVLWQSTPAVSGTLLSDLIIAPKSQGTGILTLTLESTSPQLAADVINQLMLEYQQATIEEKNETTLRTKSFVDDRLAVVSKELDSITGRLLAYQQANNIIDPGVQTTDYFSRYNNANQALNDQQLQLGVAQHIDEYLRDRANDYSTTPSSLGLTDPTLSTLIAAYNVAQLERKKLIDGNVPPANIKVQQLDEQIEKLRQNILENLKNIKEVYRATISNLQQTSNEVQAQIRSLPAKQQNLVDIKRQQESKLAVYNFLMEKREESSIALASTISNIKVLEDATPNKMPVKPNRRNIQMIALFVGLALPALAIFVIELLNDKVTSRQDIEKVTDAPIVGEIGHSFATETLVVRTNNRSIIGEQFRTIRSNLQYILTNIEKPVILVTSSFSGEGKSFVSTNLGAVMALANKKTIVLEFDIRKPKILSQLKISKKPGLTNYLLGKATVETLPVKVEGHDNLYVLPCGPVPPNPGELLLDPRLNQLFDYLKQQFDVVIIDTAPVGMVSDALTLSPYANSTLYIIRQGHTFKKQLYLIDEYYREGKLPKIALVLNDVKAELGYGYYGYGKYTYGSGYFEDETPEPTFRERWFGWLPFTKK